jgi:hypothetical protein
MQSKIPDQTHIWSVLASRFQSELELQKSRIWRLSGFRGEYGGPAEGDPHRERELMALIEELAGLLVRASALEAENRQFATCRRAGRPKDVMTPYLARELLSVFLRCHNRAGRQSVVVGTTTEGKSKQGEAGELFWFIDTIIHPLNQYLKTELHRRPLSAARVARYALDDRRPMAREIKQAKAAASTKNAAIAIEPQAPPFVIALRKVFAIPE